MGQQPASERVKRLREGIIQAIPTVPNSKESLEALAGKSLTDLLIVYTNWAIRFVAQRKRTVVVEDSAKVDDRWISLADRIAAFLERASNGDDLTPYLSTRVHRKGYSLAADTAKPRRNSWEDKDFLLNVMGFHHFHIGEVRPGNKRADRTANVVFAEVSRDVFTVLAVLDHTAFERPRSASAPMSKDRQHLWDIFDERTSRGVPPGSLFIPAMVTTSGHSLATVGASQKYVRVIGEIDPKLDDIDFVRSLYDGSGMSCPDKPKLVWWLRHLDLGVLDEASGFFGVFQYGPK
jgi:hypothetical protein